MEIWKPVLNFEGVYEASNLGNIRRSDGFHPIPRNLRAAENHHGYQNVSLSKDCVCRTYFVHRLVCEAFHGPRPDGMTINHKDGAKKNNRPENLEYLSHQENMNHAHAILNRISPTRATGARNGSVARPENLCRGEGHKSSKLSDEHVRVVRLRLAEGVKQRTIATEVGISQTQIWRIKAGLSWAHVS